MQTADPRELLQRHDALLIVDVQPDFCPGGKLAVADGDAVIPVLNRWIAAARPRGVPVYASRDWHPPRHVSFDEEGGRWPAHCVQDTPGAAYHPELALPADAIKISKGTRLDHDQYSAFDETGLTDHLRRHGVRRLFVGGLAQDVCVRATALDGRTADFAVHVIVNATRPVDPQQGQVALRELEAAGVGLLYRGAQTPAERR